MQTEVPKGVAKERGEQRNLRKMFKILREIQLNIRVEKINTYEGITVKALLDNKATEMFINKKNSS